MSKWNSIQSMSSNERKELIENVKELVKDPAQYIPKKGKMQIYTTDDTEAYVRENSELLFIKIEGTVIPSLQFAREVEIIAPKIVVDKGAIRFVTNGADIMRPGIVEIDDDVLEGGVVIITEEVNDSPLCFGIARYDAVDMREMDSGKVVDSLHYLSDEWWEFVP